ncbi:hypothetical protein PybrP1_001439, partial [[Pythium] brassicae (nom. inval.)]
VYVRTRPCADGQKPPEDMFERNRDTQKNIVIKDTERMQYGNHAFSFDHIFWVDTSQATLIFGESGEKAGLLSRSIESLFEYVDRNDNKSKEFTLVVSFLEIYCDRVRDLSRDYLKKTGRPISYQTSSSTEWFLRQVRRSADEEYDYEKASFEIHEDAQGSVFVKDLAMVTVSSREEVDALVQSGLKLRATHETKMNAVSSRSHTVFTIHVFQQSGNCFTILLATIHPMKEHYEECLGTLQFANRCRSVQNQPRVNHINGSVADKDRRIRRLQEELAALRRQLEGLRTDYNHKFVAALNELGFDAEEVTESGEIKFADGLVLRASNQSQMQATRRANEVSKRDRDSLRLKYANAKNNFTLVVSEARKEKEELRRSLTGQRRRIAALEESRAQQAKEYERALAAEEAKHRAEIRELLSRNPHASANAQEQQHETLMWRQSASIVSLSGDASAVAETAKREKKLLKRVAALQSAKEDEIALIRQHLQQLQVATACTVDSLREDCVELYAFVGRLLGALESGQRGAVATPKNILADAHKLRHLKALIATDTSRSLQQLGRVSTAATDSHSEVRTARPVSAPVRRSKTTTATATPSYPAALRDRISQTTRSRPVPKPTALDADSRDEVVFERQDSPRKKNKALMAANVALAHQSQRSGVAYSGQ